MTVLDLVRIIRRNLLILLICVLVGLVGAGAWTLTKPPVYGSSATGLVVSADTSSVYSTTSGDLLAQQRATSYVNLIGTGAIRTRAAEILAQGSPGVPLGNYSASVMPGTAFIVISSTALSPDSARATADAALQALIDEAIHMETYGTVQTMENPPEDLSKLTTIHILPYEAAARPSAPHQQHLLRNLLIGLAAGLLIGMGIALIRRQLDVQVRTQTDVEELTGHAVIGIVPEVKQNKQARANRDLLHGGQTSEALRKLRTNLRFLNVDNPPRSILMTSATPGEGKSTISANLARLIAMSGEKVVLIDCDLRRPVQSQSFGVDARLGVTQVLAGDVDVRDALLDTSQRNLRLLPAGRIPPNPSELLGSQKMRELIENLARDYMVIIDGPPMLAVTDASLLSTAVDGVVFVTTSGKTPKEQLLQCAKQTKMVGATFLGTVLNRVTRHSMGDAMYGYGGYGYGAKASKYYRNYEPIPAATAAPQAERA